MSYLKTPTKTQTKSTSNTIRTPMSSRGTKMTIEELNDDLSNIQDQTNDCIANINDAKVEIGILIAKTNCYAKNTTISYHDTLTPHKKEEDAPYRRSPFGKKLQITDYSYVCTPKGSKYGKY